MNFNAGFYYYIRLKSTGPGPQNINKSYNTKSLMRCSPSSTDNMIVSVWGFKKSAQQPGLSSIQLTTAWKLI